MQFINILILLLVVLIAGLVIAFFRYKNEQQVAKTAVKSAEEQSAATDNIAIAVEELGTGVGRIVGIQREKLTVQQASQLSMGGLSTLASAFFKSPKTISAKLDGYFKTGYIAEMAQNPDYEVKLFNEGPGPAGTTVSQYSVTFKGTTFLFRVTQRIFDENRGWWWVDEANERFNATTEVEYAICTNNCDSECVLAIREDMQAILDKHRLSSQYRTPDKTGLYEFSLDSYHELVCEPKQFNNPKSPEIPRALESFYASADITVSGTKLKADMTQLRKLIPEALAGPAPENVILLGGTGSGKSRVSMGIVSEMASMEDVIVVKLDTKSLDWITDEHSSTFKQWLANRQGKRTILFLDEAQGMEHSHVERLLGYMDGPESMTYNVTFFLVMNATKEQLKTAHGAFVRAKRSVVIELNNLDAKQANAALAAISANEAYKVVNPAPFTAPASLAEVWDRVTLVQEPSAFSKLIKPQIVV